MIDKNKISCDLKYIEAMTQNGASPNLDEYWNEIVNMLSQNLNETKEYLSNCDEHEIWLMSGYFEDISYNFQDEKFVDFLCKWQEDHPNVDIKQDIQWAKDALN